MESFLNEISALFTTSPGNLVYHLVLAFSVAGALQGAITHWRTSGFPQAKRTLIGLGILLVLQLVLFLVSGLAWIGLLDIQIFLPSIDRAVTLISLVWITWLWAFPEPARPADTANVLMSLLVFVFMGLSIAFWQESGSTTITGLSVLDFIWQVLTLAFLVLALFATVIRKPNGWGNGTAMLLLSFLGHLFYILLPKPDGDFPGIVRLAQLAAYPMLLTLPQRFPSPVKHLKAVKEDLTIPERRRYSTDPKTFHALLALAAELDNELLGQAVTRSIAQAMLADLCFLIRITPEKRLFINWGYDLIREEALESTDLDSDAAPLLASAILRGRPLRLPASGTSSDMKGLGQILGLSNPGHLMSVPITKSGQETMGSILLLSPYSNRLWSPDDQSFLGNVTSLLAPIIERGERMDTLSRERDKATHAASAAHAQASDAQKKYDDLLQQFEIARKEIVENQRQAENMAALLAVQEESQQLIAQLQIENESLRKSAEGLGSTTSTSHLENELKLTLKEVARLQNALADSNVKILELEKQFSSPVSHEQTEVIASISQELRQPMSSIIGYTDLLLGESVGILGALQRKFLERIKASTERIGGLIDDLIQITTLESGALEIKPEPIDLNLIIDNAMAYTSTQVREKNITIRLDIADAPPHILADRESFQQILIHLLQNASSATLIEGTISLRIKLQKENDQQYILMQVSDTGGGIPTEDLQRVFERRYRADNVLIQGLGDTGVGLSIAKTLVEAQNGRIWVETEMGQGSTFSALLPVFPAAQENG